MSEKNNVIHRLKNIDAQEVSIVTTGANKKKFVIMKRDENDKLNKKVEIIDKLEEGDIDTIKELAKTAFDSLSEENLKEIGYMKYTEKEAKEDKEETSKSDDDNKEKTKEKTSKSDDKEEKTNEVITKLQEEIKKLSSEVKKQQDKVETLKLNTAQSQTEGDKVNKGDEKPVTDQNVLGMKKL